jgi:cyanophycinase-like exopeptidase
VTKTIKNDFWGQSYTPFAPLLSTVTDSHFDTRDRMGRLVTFLARVIYDNRWAGRPPARAIGVDQQTAFLMQHANDGKSPYGTLTYSAISAPGVFGAVYF